ncbi:MAG: ABC transporter permease, partial [bacterium]|nr:ABC transporter permease [bacterium]
MRSLERIVRIKDLIKIKDLKRISCLLILLTIATGVCALLLLFSINEAGKKEVLKGIKKAGNSHLLFLSSTFFTQNGKEGGILSYHDISLLKNRVPQIGETALWDFQNIYSIKIGDREHPQENASYSMTPMMSGVTPEFRKAVDIELKDGRFINKTDLSYKRRVCVVGGKLYERLGGEKIIGKTLIAKRITETEYGTEEEVKFTIIGIFNKKIPLLASVPDKVFTSIAPFLFKAPDNSHDKIGDSKAFQKQQNVISNLVINDSLFIPWTVWMDVIKKEYSLSGSSLPPYTQILIKVKIPEDIGKYVKDEGNVTSEEIHCKNSDCSFEYYLPEKIKEVVDKIRKILKERWGNDKTFAFTYSGIFIDEIEIQVRESNRLLGIIITVAMFLSGTLLASMMLMSVHKRVSEIGLRRAFGARRKDIFYQFLTEGAVIYSVGIVIGLVVGSILSYFLIVKLLGWKYSMPIYSIMLSSLIPFL